MGAPISARAMTIVPLTRYTSPAGSSCGESTTIQTMQRIPTPQQDPTVPSEPEAAACMAGRRISPTERRRASKRAAAVDGTGWRDGGSAVSGGGRSGRSARWGAAAGGDGAGSVKVCRDRGGPSRCRLSQPAAPLVLATLRSFPVTFGFGG